jgi:hypothetical protein
MIDSLHGQTLISTGVGVKINPNDLRQMIGGARFLSVTTPTLDIELLLKEAENDAFLREVIGRLLTIDITVSVTAPDSRRGKNGKPNKG